MGLHLQREIGILKGMLMSLSAKVEQSVREATLALEERDAGLAHRVIDSDIVIDQMEVELEEECLKILALHQPVAIDLRFIVAVLKINNDLERIGDLAVNIAERACFLADFPATQVGLDFSGMAQKAKQMLKEGLDALVNLNPDLARKVCADDDIVDAMNREMYHRIQEAIRARPDQIEVLIHLLSASRHLERMADHATNIAEDVLYMIKGEIVRHQTEEYDIQKKAEKK